MSKLSYKVSYYALYAMLALVAIVVVLFFVGGDAQGADVVPGVDPEMWQPAQTDLLMYLTYALLGVVVVATLVGALLQFVSALRENPGNAVKSLFGVILLAALLIITWSIGDSTPLHIPGYSGTDNVPFWLKITDMFLYSFYVLLGVTVLAIVLSGIKKKLS